MTDFATGWNAATQSGDWLLSGPDLSTDQGFQTAVIISLMTDRLAAADDVIPDGTTDRRGWWGDMPLDPTNGTDTAPDYIGSRLWLLSRAKATEATRQNAMTYCREALQWLLTIGAAQRVDVVFWWLNGTIGTLIGVITITRQVNGQPVDTKFNFAWNATIGAAVSAA